MLPEISINPTFMLVAGELSGDELGAGLIIELKKQFPHAEFFGVGGEKMIDAGLQSIVPMDVLSVMGLIEVLKHLPNLLRLKSALINEALERMPIAFIGIDAPDFNLRLALSLKHIGITTFQYVSPSVWVWREKRVFTIKKAIDKVLCLFPFETNIYQRHKIDSACVGHRLANTIPLVPETQKARAILDINTDNDVLAILPGSRKSEVSRLLKIFIATAEELFAIVPNLIVVIPAATVDIENNIDSFLKSNKFYKEKRIIVLKKQASLAIEASDAVLLASGTATLETMLYKKPMVVAYKFSSITAWLARRLVKTKYFSLPNILGQKEIVPEVFQNEVTEKKLLPLVQNALAQKNDKALMEEYTILHKSLKMNSDKIAADSIVEKLLSTVEK